MTTQQQATLKAFGWSLAIQLVAYVLYVIFGVDRSGGETTLQNYYFFFYFPIMLICLWFQSIFTVTGWGSIWFMIYIAPVLGSLVYSGLYASAVWKWNAFWQDVEDGTTQRVDTPIGERVGREETETTDRPPSVN